MPTIFQQYEYAKLAAAAYVNFSGVAYTDGRLIAEAAATNQGIVPLALANQLFARDPIINPNPWTVIGAPHNNDAAGFHAALFGRGTEKVLAIAGTEPSVGGQVDLDLLLADVAQIGTYGVAYAQAVSLINYVLRLTAPAGASNVLQLDLSHRLPPSNEWDPGATGGDPGVTGNYFSVETRYEGTGLGGINAGDLITVTGHSLGGHLAAFARRLFPNIISEAYTYNAPGFDPATSVKLADEFVALFTPFLPGPPAASFGELNIATYRSDDLAPGNPALVSSWLTGTPPSTPTYISTEQNSHGIGQIVDSLALQSLFARMDTGLTDAKARALFDAASPDTADSEERLLESLHRVLVGSIDKLPEVKAGADAVFSSDGNFAARTAWYDKFVKVEAAIVARPALQLTYLTTFSAADLATVATNPDAFATRYALKELNPFALLGADYSSYEQTLALYDSATDTGTLTPQWIEDRSSMLYWSLLANTADAQVLRRNDITGAWDYEDRNTGEKVGVEQTGATWSPRQRRKFIFGTDGAETLRGDIFVDHLYGAAGTDTLIGNAGDDYLEGGTGDDKLRGGTGLDTYRIDKYSGTDTLIDNADAGGDGQGRIVYNGQDLTGTLTQDGTTRNLYHSTVNEALQIRYIGAEGARGDLIIIDPTPGGSKIILQDWASRELGLTLAGSDATPVTPTPSTHDIIGDPLIHSANIAPGGEGADWRVTLTYNQQYQDNPDGSQTVIRYDVDYFRIDADGNPIEAGGPARADNLAGTAANDHIVSGGEGDTITLSLGGNDDIDTGSGEDSVTKYGNGKLTIDLGADADHLYNYGSSGTVTLSAGTGRDYAAGGSADDLLQGDQDGDVLTGGAGDDRLYGDSEISLELAVTQGNSDTGSGQQGDWLTGNTGDDSLVAGSGNDVLSGGGGTDLLIGGAGDDDLLGDTDWVPTSFDWSVTDRADGSRYFYPTSGTLFPADGGNDVIYAGAGNDRVWGGIGDDLVTGDGGADKVYGEQGNDVLVGGDGDDWRLRIPHKCRRWRDGDSCSGSANQDTWRAAA